MKPKYILILILITSVFVAVTFLGQFTLFEEPKVIEHKSDCDYDGIRAVRTELISGNATLNRSLHIGLTECGDSYIELQDEDIFFIADGNPSIHDVEVHWLNYCAIKIQYNSNLRIFRQDSLFDDSANCEQRLRIYYESQ